MTTEYSIVKVVLYTYCHIRLSIIHTKLKINISITKKTNNNKNGFMSFFNILIPLPLTIGPKRIEVDKIKPMTKTGEKNIFVLSKSYGNCKEPLRIFAKVSYIVEILSVSGIADKLRRLSDF